MMTRQPLMLSDTAMVLLRRYSEQDDAYWANHTALSQLIPKTSIEWDRARYVWYETHNHYSEIRQVQGALMVEIWLLWAFPDIPIVRRLNWHLVLNDSLMTMAEIIFISPQEFRRQGMRVTKKPDQAVWFLEMLETLYKRASPHLKTVSHENQR